MATQLMIKKLNKEVRDLRGDLHEIKKFLFAPLKDSEGEYQKSFIKRILAREQSNGPFYRFADKKTFLKHVHSSK